jgi:hypothetical protein
MAAGPGTSFWSFSKVTWRVLWRAARQLFHEITGAIFAVFALYGAVAAWRQWHSRVAAWLMGAAIAYALMMAGFAFSSFLRARRVR